MILDKSQINNDIKWFLSNCHIYTYPSKSTLIHQGEKIETLLYIIKGIVSVFIKDDEGKEIVLYHLSAKDFIGEKGLFEKTKNSKYWVKAKISCEIAEISYKNFFHLTKVNKNILVYLTYRMSKRLQIMPTEKINNLEFVSKMGKIAKILLNMKKNSMYVIHTNNNITEIKMDFHELSKISSYSKSFVKKVLRIFKQQKFIDIKDSSIIINNFY